jgi:hypothetical protein
MSSASANGSMLTVTVLPLATSTPEPSETVCFVVLQPGTGSMANSRKCSGVVRDYESVSSSIATNSHPSRNVSCRLAAHYGAFSSPPPPPPPPATAGAGDCPRIAAAASLTLALPACDWREREARPSASGCRVALNCFPVLPSREGLPSLNL